MPVLARMGRLAEGGAASGGRRRQLMLQPAEQVIFKSQLAQMSVRHADIVGIIKFLILKFLFFILFLVKDTSSVF